MPTKVEYESVKIKKEIVEMVRENKKKTRISITGFFETLALKELKLPKQKSK